MNIKRYFSIREAAELASLKPGMVDYLCRSGTLVPTGRHSPGRGRRRLYTFGDIVMLRAIAHFLRCGVAVAKLRKAFKQLRRRHKNITPSSLPGVYLVTDGVSVFFREKNDVLEDLTSGQLTFAFLVELPAIREEVASKARQSKAIVGSPRATR